MNENNRYKLSKLKYVFHRAALSLAKVDSRMGSRGASSPSPALDPGSGTDLPMSDTRAAACGSPGVAGSATDPPRGPSHQ